MLHDADIILLPGSLAPAQHMSPSGDRLSLRKDTDRPETSYEFMRAMKLVENQRCPVFVPVMAGSNGQYNLYNSGVMGSPLRIAAAKWDDERAMMVTPLAKADYSLSVNFLPSATVLPANTTATVLAAVVAALILGVFKGAERNGDGDVRDRQIWNGRGPGEMIKSLFQSQINPGQPRDAKHLSLRNFFEAFDSENVEEANKRLLRLCR